MHKCQLDPLKIYNIARKHGLSLRHRNPEDLTSGLGISIEIGSFTHAHDTISLSMILVIIRRCMERASVVPDSQVIGVPSVSDLHYR